jgi:hypothetical protein
VYIQAPLESDAQFSKASKPAMSSLHNPAVFAQSFTAFNASPCNATDNSALFEISPAAWVVVPFISMKFVWPPARTALQSFDCGDGIYAPLKQHRIVPVGPTDKHHQWNASSIHNDVTFGA